MENKKVYTVSWTDRVTYTVEIEADSEEEALHKYDNEDYNKHLVEMSDQDYIQEPYIEDSYERE